MGESERKLPNEGLLTRIVHHLEKNGACSIKQLTTALGHSITGVEAVRRAITWRRAQNLHCNLDAGQLARQGRRLLISDRLCEGNREGRVKRIKTGVYCVANRDVKRKRSVFHANSNLRSKVVAYVLKHGQCTTREVRSALAHEITAPEAIARARVGLNYDIKRKIIRPNSSVYTVGRLVELGRRLLIGDCLRRAFAAHKIDKIKRGVYCPPKLRLYKPGRAG